jgi:hypothetical protein
MEGADVAYWAGHFGLYFVLSVLRVCVPQHVY